MKGTHVFGTLAGQPVEGAEAEDGVELVSRSLATDNSSTCGKAPQPPRASAPDRLGDNAPKL